MKALQGRGRPERVVLAARYASMSIGSTGIGTPPSGGPPKRSVHGAIGPGAGVLMLVRAMAAIVQERDARHVIAGSDAAWASIRSCATASAKLGVADKVEVLGAVDHDQLPTLIATATVCVVPSAPDLVPNPTVLYPTKLLEYMACRRAVVAPRSDTVKMVVDNGREALLFEPGDPIDLAKKVLRLLGEPLLRDRLAKAAYERVRRDFTASAARRAIRSAYGVLSSSSSRRSSSLVDGEGDEQRKVEILSDDDFEATVFEEVGGAGRQQRHQDTAVNMRLTDRCAPCSRSTSRASSRSRASPTSRAPSRSPRRRRATGRSSAGSCFRTRATAARGRASTWRGRRARPTNWVVSDIASAGKLTAERAIAEDSSEVSSDDGTPIEGVAVVSPTASHGVVSAFVAGEIDVPTPSPELRDRGEPMVDYTAAGGLLGAAPEQSDPDTGSRTPPLERR